MYVSNRPIPHLTSDRESDFSTFSPPYPDCIPSLRAIPRDCYCLLWSFKNRSSSDKAYIKSRSSRLSGKSTQPRSQVLNLLRLYPYFVEPHFRAGSCSYAPAKRHTPSSPQFFVAINP
ncbi:hypothetical protein CBS115989_1425 [Aspergillus niger]|nr:hypothetical protein CBS115989_1425 [Aspergillus niger]KAI2856783.1 hypothetical protein CBS11232_3499 [Aspergillus niger]KAI2876136.1 hypothetical protein CBS115988_4917 [Aspergillus niger]